MLSRFVIALLLRRKRLLILWLLSLSAVILEHLACMLVFEITSLNITTLSRSSHVWLCATPETAAHQALPSLGLFRQEHWRRLPFPSPMHESEKWKWICSVVSDSATPCPPSSSVHGILQAGVLEWGAIAFPDLNLTATLFFSFTLETVDYILN